MQFVATEIGGAYIVELERKEDARGFFARTWCQEEFKNQGLISRVAQSNLSWNRRKGTLRGMHYQVAPFEESKLVRCTRGAIYDVIVDLRSSSHSYKKWIGVELTASNHRALYVPEGFAHGFLTLVDDTEVVYQVSESYHPDSERGARFDDLAFKILWPAEIQVVSEKDKNWPDYKDDNR